MSEEQESVPKQVFEGEATRSKQSERYDLISPYGLKALAHRLALGAERHGDRNWETGGEAFRQATISHLMAHLRSYMEQRNVEDTEAMICNAMFLAHFEANRDVPAEPTGVVRGYGYEQEIAALRESLTETVRMLGLNNYGSTVPYTQRVDKVNAIVEKHSLEVRYADPR